MTPADIQLTVRGKLNELRALDRIVNSTEFLQCLRLDPNNGSLDIAIMNVDLEAVRDWMDTVIRRDLCEMSIRSLRILASQLGVKNYTGLPKDELLILLVQAKHELRQAKDDVGGMSCSTNGTQAISG